MVREKPASLTVPAAINQVWSMNFMHDDWLGQEVGCAQDGADTPLTKF